MMDQRQALALLLLVNASAALQPRAQASFGVRFQKQWRGRVAHLEGTIETQTKNNEKQNHHRNRKTRTMFVQLDMVAQPIVATESSSSETVSSMNGASVIPTSNDADRNKGQTTTDEPTAEARKTKQVRPFHQNWWPAVQVNALKEDRPNQLHVLGQPLVAFYDKTASKWNVLDDRCSHRFAPLSEGRIASDCSSLLCSYHGWEFNGNGTCTRLPQQPDRVDFARKVQSYEVREDLGILWVWMDPETAQSLGESIALPINPLVRRCYEAMGPASGYMRDLPYGMEILGENLIDLSHLPHAHHSVGSLSRSLGNELPTRMLSAKQREQAAEWETTYGPEPLEDPVLPRFQAEIVNAAAHDPLLMTSPGADDPVATKNWTTRIGYYDPCHVRYRRYKGVKGTAGHVELFFCPTMEGRSRVFLVNCFEAILPEKTPEANSFADRVRRLSPKNVKAKLKLAIIKKMIGGSAGHMMAHKIFDGDGIFLHKQGNRMRVANLTYADYSTPSSSDVLLNAYRRFLNSAEIETRKAGKESMADAVVGTKSYGDDAPRGEMLDRYNTHTVHCPYCMESLQKARKRKSILQGAKTAFQGATGSGIASLGTLAAIRRFSSVAVAPSVFGCVALACGATLAGNRLSAMLERSVDKEINGYIFEDYIHAEKD